MCAHKRYNMMNITEESRGHWNLLVCTFHGRAGRLMERLREKDISTEWKDLE